MPNDAEQARQHTRALRIVARAYYASPRKQFDTANQLFDMVATFFEAEHCGGQIMGKRESDILGAATDAAWGANTALQTPVGRLLTKWAA